MAVIPNPVAASRVLGLQLHHCVDGVYSTQDERFEIISDDDNYAECECITVPCRHPDRTRCYKRWFVWDVDAGDYLHEWSLLDTFAQAKMLLEARLSHDPEHESVHHRQNH